MTTYKLTAKHGNIQHEFIYRDLSKALYIANRCTAKNFDTNLLKIHNYV